MVTWSQAGYFILGGCLIGTNGEGLLDSAVGLTVRRSLASGKSGLAIANQMAVLLSMLLALLSETKLVRGNASERGLVFIGLWLIVNLIRAVGFSLGLISDDSKGQVIVALFVFFDKFTGPLGNAALEVALLTVLASPHPKEDTAPPLIKQARVPAAFLLTLRMTTEAVCRPWAELLLQPPGLQTGDRPDAELGEHWPLPVSLVVVVLLVGAAGFVWHNLSVVVLEREKRD